MLSPLETKLLSLLKKHGASTAGELLRLSSNEIKRGAIYVTLQRMVDKGLLTRVVGFYEATAEGLETRLKAKEWMGL